VDLKSSIYLIEDDPAVRDALVIFLEIHGYAVNAFESSEVFLESIDELNQRVLVLDIRLPGMSGIELQTELKKRKYEMPVIFITGHADDEIRETATEDGIIDYIDKPIDHSSLLRCIEAALIRHVK
jgi:two-component system, LuxR family, response regulator TtrR